MAHRANQPPSVKNGVVKEKVRHFRIIQTKIFVLFSPVGLQTARSQQQLFKCGEFTFFFVTRRTMECHSVLAYIVSPICPSRHPRVALRRILPLILLPPQSPSFIIAWIPKRTMAAERRKRGRRTFLMEGFYILTSLPSLFLNSVQRGRQDEETDGSEKYK